jgi:NADP-dependent 3-hydroxy acid dehydrogenase YdfG
MQDRVVVITGASAGIGAALAELLAAQGARPVLVARRHDALEAVASRCGPHAMTVVADVTDRAQVEATRDAALTRFGHVDAWVNNAGRGIDRLPSMLTDEDLDEMMRVNVKSVLYGVQAILPHFRARGRGHILAVSSMLGRLPFAPQRSAYAAAKHALVGLMANLRVELAASDPEIAISCVHPGMVDTAFAANALHATPGATSFGQAQGADEVARIIADTLARPRADVYTRPEMQPLVVDYFGAPDLGAFERATFGTRRGPAR